MTAPQRGTAAGPGASSLRRHLGLRDGGEQDAPHPSGTAGAGTPCPSCPRDWGPAGRLSTTSTGSSEPRTSREHLPVLRAASPVLLRARSRFVPRLQGLPPATAALAAARGWYCWPQPRSAWGGRAPAPALAAPAPPAALLALAGDSGHPTPSQEGPGGTFEVKAGPARPGICLPPGLVRVGPGTGAGCSRGDPDLGVLSEPRPTAEPVLLLTRGPRDTCPPGLTSGPASGWPALSPSPPGAAVPPRETWARGIKRRMFNGMLKYFRRRNDFNGKTELGKIGTAPDVGDLDFGATELPAAPPRPPKAPEMTGGADAASRQGHRGEGAAARPSRASPGRGLGGPGGGRTGPARSPGACGAGAERCGWSGRAGDAARAGPDGCRKADAQPGAARGGLDHSGSWGAPDPT